MEWKIFSNPLIKVNANFTMNIGIRTIPNIFIECQFEHTIMDTQFMRHSSLVVCISTQPHFFCSPCSVWWCCCYWCVAWLRWSALWRTGEMLGEGKVTYAYLQAVQTCTVLGYHTILQEHWHMKTIVMLWMRQTWTHPNIQTPHPRTVHAHCVHNH